MPENTKIEWCAATINPVWGCDNNCEYCYARGIARRFGGEVGKKEKRYLREHNLACDIDVEILQDFYPTFLESQYAKLESLLKKWDSPRCKRRSIFLDSMSDIAFWQPEWVERVLELIRQHPKHAYLLLTKDPAVYGRHEWPSSVWCGVTATNQEEADKLIPELFQEAVKQGIENLFVSLEPMRGEIEIMQYLRSCVACQRKEPDCGYRHHGEAIHLKGVIVGGMTGAGALPMHPDWARRIRDDCRMAGVDFFFKQWGEWIAPFQMTRPSELYGDWLDEVPKWDDRPFCRRDIHKPVKVGKKAAGRLLDGREWNDLPWRKRKTPATDINVMGLDGRNEIGG